MNRPNDKNGYILSRQWFDFAFENQGKVKPNHGILYLWLIELNNKLGWTEAFGVPTLHSMAAIGVSSYKTYKKAFDDLVKWGLVEVHAISQNQHTTKVISLNIAFVKNTTAHDSAMVNNTKASPKHLPKQVQSTAHIKKQRNKETINLMSEVFTPDYKPINNYDSISFKIWKQVYENMNEKNIRPTTLQKTKVKNWTNDVKLMIEKDGRTEEEIDEVLKFLRENDFWAENIKCTSKLREKFEDLLSRARTPKLNRKEMSSAFKGSEQNYQLSNNEI